MHQADANFVGIAGMVQLERTADGSYFIGGEASMSGVRQQLRCEATSEQVAARVQEWMP